MKWKDGGGCLIRSADGKYLVMQATNGWWVAYEISAFNNTAEKIAEKDSEEGAKTACDDYERDMEVLRKLA
jgi:hypothetical protein